MSRGSQNFNFNNEMQKNRERHDHELQGRNQEHSSWLSLFITLGLIALGIIALLIFW